MPLTMFILPNQISVATKTQLKRQRFNKTLDFCFYNLNFILNKNLFKYFTFLHEHMFLLAYFKNKFHIFNKSKHKNR